MRRYMLIVGLLVLAVSPVRPDTTEPGEPDLVLPPMILEVEDPALEAVEAVIPEGEDITLMPGAVELPEPDDMIIPRDAFDLVIPGGPDGGSPAGMGGRDFFSESTLGIGTQNYFIGSISLFMLGGEPRARLHFHHEGRDGFGDHVSGEGFHSRRDSFDGEISYSPGILDIDAAGSLTEEEFGLQGRAADYSSVLYRNFSGSAKADYSVSDSLSLGGSLQSTLADIVLAGALPDRNTEVDAAAVIYGSLQTEYLRLGLDGGYRFLDWFNTGEPAHIISAGLHGESNFPFALDISVDTEMRWVPGSVVVFPFNLTATAYLGGVVTAFLSGGYRWDRLSYEDLWGQFFLVDAIPGEDTTEALWYIESEVRYEPSDRFSLRAEGSWKYALSRFQPDELSGRGLFGQLWDSGSSLHLASGLSWDILESLSLEAGLGGIILGSDASRPGLEVSASAEFVPPEGIYGLSAAFDMFSHTSRPKLSLGGFLKAGEGVSLIVDAEDIISAFSEEPSYTWGGYEEPGFALTFKTKLSL